MWQIWLIAAGVFIIGEIITVGFLIFWLAIAARKFDTFFLKKFC